MSLATIPQASKWASDFLKKEVLPTNISYLVQYGKIKKYGESGSTMLDLDDLKRYYDSYNGRREVNWKKNLGDDLNWMLSFDNLREKDTTKHVHRLHPYKGKYIPQLVEYFIDSHTDDFKKEAYFKTGDIILDPFLGSGTTIIQSLEMGLHSVGIDVSEFNCMISSCKATRYNNEYLQKAIKKMLASLDTFEHENKFSTEKEREFLPIYQKLLKKYSIKLKQDKTDSFLDIWFMDNVRREIDHVFQAIKQEKDVKTRKILALILSRTIRSCRATTHSDLATLKEP